ncbi:hypothetical protein [Vibrio owensii]|uniref:hypothetical protein n=1 Tax=Vibrio owensii TaxID=696485 RepID=UPI002FF17EBA
MNRDVVLASTFAMLLTACNSTTKNNIVNYEAEGNLRTSEPVSCVAVNELTNKSNPVDLFYGVNSCLDMGDYAKAADLYLVGMSYGLFDTKRVIDQTAHQAIPVLRVKMLRNKPQSVVSNFQEALNRVISESTPICDNLIKLGPPQYIPTYMLQHGLRGDNAEIGLHQDFDPNKTWKNTLLTIAKCV